MVPLLGECPITSSWRFDGTNEGVAGGRNCWEIRLHSNHPHSTRICGGADCQSCKFRLRVCYEQSVSREVEILPSTVA